MSHQQQLPLLWHPHVLELEVFMSSLRSDLVPEAGLGKGEGIRDGQVGPMKENVIEVTCG